MYGVVDVVSHGGRNGAAAALHFQLSCRRSSLATTNKHRAEAIKQHRALHRAHTPMLPFTRTEGLEGVSCNTNSRSLVRSSFTLSESNLAYQQQRLASSTTNNRFTPKVASPTGTRLPGRAMQPQLATSRFRPGSRPTPQLPSQPMPIIPSQESSADIEIVTLKSSRYKRPEPLYPPIEPPAKTYRSLYHAFSPKNRWSHTSDSYLAPFVRELENMQNSLKNLRQSGRRRKLFGLDRTRLWLVSVVVIWMVLRYHYQPAAAKAQSTANREDLTQAPPNPERREPTNNDGAVRTQPQTDTTTDSKGKGTQATVPVERLVETLHAVAGGGEDGPKISVQATTSQNEEPPSSAPTKGVWDTITFWKR